MKNNFTIYPVAFVKNERKNTDDDYWGNVISEIILTDEFSKESLKGIEEFSHLEIIFYFHKALSEEFKNPVSHPRGNTDFPETGIFAQRKKARPNSLGASIVRLLSVKDKILSVSGLDAIDGTPVIDIKPVLKEFLPSGEIRQPHWSSEIMKNYWKEKD